MTIMSKKKCTIFDTKQIPSEFLNDGIYANLKWCGLWSNENSIRKTSKQKKNLYFKLCAKWNWFFFRNIAKKMLHFWLCIFDFRCDDQRNVFHCKSEQEISYMIFIMQTLWSKQIKNNTHFCIGLIIQYTMMHMKWIHVQHIFDAIFTHTRCTPNDIFMNGSIIDLSTYSRTSDLLNWQEELLSFYCC